MSDSTKTSISAPPQEVFDYLIQANRMVEWMDERAVLEAKVGGRYEIDIQGVLIRGTIVELRRPDRLVVSWGELGHAAFPPGSSRVTFELDATGEGTRLTLHHDGLPATERDGYATGWRHFLHRLVDRVDAAQT